MDAEGGLSLTEEEVVERLAALGISREVASRAIDGIPETLPPSADGAVRLTRDVVIEGVVPTDRHEAIAEAIAAAMKMEGRVSVVGNKLTWVPGGAVIEPAVVVHSNEGRTRIRYVETLPNRWQRALGLGTVGGMGGFVAGVLGALIGVAISKTAGIPAAQGAPVVLAVAVILAISVGYASIRALQRAFARRAQQRAELADAVMARVVPVTRDAIDSSSPRARIAAPAAADEVFVEEEEEMGVSTKGRRASF